jgi:hypothetical protein
MPGRARDPFDPAEFFRVAYTGAATSRHQGPYDATIDPALGTNPGKNPTEHLETGAVPGFGAKAIAATGGTHFFGMARRPTRANRAQFRDPGTTVWRRPYHELKVVTFPATGTHTKIFDLGATPANPVQLRVDDVQPHGTSIGYALQGRNLTSDPWTALGAAVDGQELVTPAERFRYYELAATLAAGPAAGTRYVTPILQSAALTERVRFSTYRHLAELDADESVDPLTGQTKIGELTVPMLRAGVRDRAGRRVDLATKLATEVAPSRLEAQVYAVNTRDVNPATRRYFLNSYRLDNRDPGNERESFTFVSGLDRLKVRVPAEVETYSYPPTGGDAVAASVITDSTTPDLVARNVVGVDVSVFPLTPFTAGALTGLRCRIWADGDSAHARDYTITKRAGYTFPADENTTSSFRIEIPVDEGVPAVGWHFTISSDVIPQAEAVYTNADLADVWLDVRDVQARVPARLRGRRPLPDPARKKTTHRLVTTRDDTDKGATATDVLQHVSLIQGGATVWERGRICFVDLYGEKESVLTWDERHLVSLDPTVGADRRTPLLPVRFGWDPAREQFAGELKARDQDALDGWGVATIEAQRLQDDLCKWFSGSEGGAGAQDFALRMLAAWSTGVRLWPLETVFAYPWLRLGDQVTVITDQYTDRVLAFERGTTDIGSPVRGRTAALAVIVGKNLWGTKFVVAVRGLRDIMGTDALVASGGLGGPLDPIGIPGDFAAVADALGTPTGNVAFVRTSFTPPASPYFDAMEYSVRARKTGTVTWSTAARIAGTRAGPDRIPATFGTDVEVTPVTVSTGRARLSGTPIIVPIGDNPQAELLNAAGTAPLVPGDVVREASRLVVNFALDPDFAFGEVYIKRFATGTAPASAMSVEFSGALLTVIRRGDGRTSIVVDGLDAATPTAAVTIVCYNGLAQRGMVFVAQLDRNAAATTPAAPTALAIVSAAAIAGVVVRGTMPNPLGSPSPDVLRLYRDGGVVLEVARTAGAGATQDITDPGPITPGSYGYRLATVSAAGIESATSAGPQIATVAAAAVPTPTLDSAGRSGTDVTLSWTPGASTPAGTDYTVEARTTGSGSPFAAVSLPTSSSSITVTLAAGKDVRIVARCTSWNDSAPSNVIAV